MEQFIKAVEIITQQEEGPERFEVGTEVSFDGPKIADIIEINGAFFLFDSDDNRLMEIRNCPIIVFYGYEKSEV